MNMLDFLGARNSRASLASDDVAASNATLAPLGDRRLREIKLRAAVERQEFVLHYQPQVSVDTGKLVTLEALIRWDSPDFGMVGPEDFIPALEASGLIREVGLWALRRAALDHLQWTAQGFNAPRITVNVSPVQLRQPDFVESVCGALAGRYVVDLEITESRILEDFEPTIQKLHELRKRGILVSLDDFGTGYSCLAYLPRLPLHALKIDRRFIDGMLEDDRMMVIVQTILGLARSLNLVTVAEGVQTEAQANMLQLLRCDHMQGYLVGKPQPVAQTAPLLGVAEAPCRAAAQEATPLPRSRDALRRYKAELAARDVSDERKVKLWRMASRVTLALLFGFSALQYYFLDVSLTIMSLRGVMVFAAY